MRYLIWCDESVSKGKIFSNFYGGLLISSYELTYVEKELLAICETLHKEGELKWGKVNHHNLPAYFPVIDKLFDFVQDGVIKIRIMFTDNRFKAKVLTHYHKAHHYHLLYYQFLKHAFGFPYLSRNEPHQLEFFFDNLPDTQEKNKLFKDYIFGLQHLPGFLEANIQIRKDAIMEVHSHHHILMQCLDVILGSFAFRMNKKHLEKLPGQNKRGKRTKAKEKLYKHILKRIKVIKPGFNPGISTGKTVGYESLWLDNYRHWVFKPSEWDWNN